MVASQTRLVPFFWRRAAVFVWCVAVAALSLLPAGCFPPAPASSWIPAWITAHADKMVHAALYGVLTGLAMWAWPATGATWRRSFFTATAATDLGLLMEVLQDFTATRGCDIMDGLADGIGAAAAAILVRLTLLRTPAAPAQPIAGEN